MSFGYRLAIAILILVIRKPDRSCGAQVLTKPSSA